MNVVARASRIASGLPPDIRVRMSARSPMEIQQQPVPDLQFERDLQIETKVCDTNRRGTQKTANDRFGNTVTTQDFDLTDQRLAEKQKDNRKRKGNKTTELVAAHAFSPSMMEEHSQWALGYGRIYRCIGQATSSPVSAPRPGARNDRYSACAP